MDVLKKNITRNFQDNWRFKKSLNIGGYIPLRPPFKKV